MVGDLCVRVCLLPIKLIGKSSRKGEKNFEKLDSPFLTTRSHCHHEVLLMYSALLKPQLEAQETLRGAYAVPAYRKNCITLTEMICKLLSELLVNHCETMSDPY